jgi:hypothetical protein
LQKRALLIPLAIVAIISILAMQVKSLQVGVQATDNFVIKSLGAFNNMLKGLSDFGNKFARFIEGLINPLIDFYNKTVDVAKGLRSVFGIEVAAADDNLTHLAKVTLPNVTFNIDGVIDATRRGFKSLGDLAFQATELEKEANALATGMDEVATSAEKVGKGSTKAKEESVKLSGAFRTTLQAAQAFARGASELTRELGGDLIASFTSKILMAGKVTKDTVSDFKDLVSEIKDRVSNALSVANQKLDEAVGRFNAYRDSIAEGILQGTGLADIAAKQTEAISAVNAAIEAQTKAQIAVNKAIADGDEDSIAKANEDLKEANDILAEAKRNQRSFLDFLRTGVDQAKAFAGQIDQLRLAGASLEVVQQIAQLGAETGSRVARELLEGGRQAIETANDLVAVVRASAVAAGTAAAETFFGAGVAAARAYIDAIRQTILELQPILDDIARRIAEALRIPMPSTNIGGGGGGGGGQLFTELGRGGVTQAGIEMVRQGQNIPDSVVASYIISDPFGTTLEEYARQLGVTGFAKGAIVRNPMMGLVGEAGPEAIIPLNRANGLGNTYNITVNPGLSTNAETGRAVVEAIKRYERTSGQVFATA